jgi:predicted enzyme related to lactoylglutathione lyase
MSIKEMAFTCYPVTNLTRARKFYEEILELKPTSTWIHGDTGMIEYDIGNATFAIGAGHFIPSKEGVFVAFEVDDFDEMIRRLKNINVPFISEPNETPVCHMAIVTDPDGSAIMIHKRKESKK